MNSLILYVFAGYNNDSVVVVQPERPQVLGRQGSLPGGHIC